MTTTLRSLKFMLALAIAGAVSTVSAQAFAACVNDIDCPEPACGGQVCDWNRNFTCHPAGDPAKPGEDGWCTTTSDCKCRNEGATCVNFYCTFTKPRATGSGGASGSSGGASGSSGGSSGSTGGAAAGTGGSTSGSGGSTSGSGGSSSGSGGSSSGSGDSGGGCSVAGSVVSMSSLAALLALTGLATFRRRGRRD